MFTDYKRFKLLLVRLFFLVSLTLKFYYLVSHLKIDFKTRH